MISCLFHSRAIRRHFDDCEPLPGRTIAHIEQCERCREHVAIHSAVVKALTAQSPRLDGPPFLHSRVMQSLTEAPKAPVGAPKFQWAALSCAVALVAIGIVIHPLNRPAPEPTWPDLGPKITLKTTLPENPLETEINHLRQDTFNAARALAANFLPEPPARP